MATKQSWKRPGSPIGKKGTAQSKPEIQAPITAAVERQGSEATPLACESQHADRGDQPEDGTSSCIYCQQGATRGHFPEAHQPLSLQSAQGYKEGKALISGWRSFFKYLTNVRLFEAVSANTCTRHTCPTLTSQFFPRTSGMALADPAYTEADLAGGINH
jgi:hypothetical protein